MEMDAIAASHSIELLAQLIQVPVSGSLLASVAAVTDVLNQPGNVWTNVQDLSIRGCVLI